MPPRSTRTPSRRRANQKVVGIDLERRQPGADRDVERAVGDVVQVPRDEQAFERSLADACALSGREVIDAADVAVRAEAAQLAFETIHEGEGRLRRLRRVLRIGVRGIHLEHGVHRLVRETPQIAELARSRDPDPAVEVWCVGTHGRSTPERTPFVGGRSGRALLPL